MRVALSLLSSLLLVLALTSTSPGNARTIRVESERIEVRPGDDALRPGRLRLDAALVLRSGDSRFGGLSSVRLTGDGGFLLAISDCGDLFSFRILRDPQGTMAGISAMEVSPLDGASGGVRDSEQWDAEGLARDPSGALLVSFERNHRVLRHPPGAAPCETPGTRVDVPAAVSQLPNNSGLETLVTLPDGRLLLVAEGEASCPGTTTAWIGGDKAWMEVAYPVVCSPDAPRDPFRPTDGAVLPGGDLVVLERRYPPSAARVRRIRSEDLSRGDLTGEILAEILSPVLLDNFEGIDAWRTPGGETRLVLLSDDNNCRKGFLTAPSTQRTLLVEYVLQD